MDTSPPDRDLAAVRWLESFINYERLAAGAPFARDTYSLAPFRALLARLGDPQDARPTLHVAGTKGKGSCALLLDRLARAAGHTTGRYTSPHLVSYRERLALDGAPIDAATFEALFARLRQVVEAGDAPAPERAFRSLFELMTAGAWLLFRERGVDVAILEVGLGGRLDATNCVARPRAALVTSIGHDHTKILGETVEEIAAEKAGIFKASCPAVIRRQEHAESAAIVATLAACAGRVGAPLVRAEEAWQVNAAGPGPIRRAGAPQRVRIARRGRPLGVWPYGLAGRHQAGNLEAALAMLEAADLGAGESDDAWVALLDRADLGGLRHEGRFEVLHADPLVVVDGAHCPLSLGALFASLAEAAPEAMAWSVGLGLLGHKEHARIAAALGGVRGVRRWWPVELDDPRSALGDVTRDLLVRAVAEPRTVAAPPAGIDAAARVREVVAAWREERAPGEALLLTGSLFLVGPARAGVRLALGAPPAC